MANRFALHFINFDNSNFQKITVREARKYKEKYPINETNNA